MKNGVTKFFDDTAGEYDAKYEGIDDLRSFIFAERKKIVLGLLGKDFGRILDAGCGPGVYAEDLISRCGELYGVDISSEMIGLAKKRRLPGARFSVEAIEKLNFEDNFFDAALCVGVLEYLNDMEKGIKEVARVTKEGGIAIFTSPNASSILNMLDHWMRTILKACRKVLKVDLSRSFINYDFQPKLLSARRLRTLLEKHGFSVEESRYHIFRVSFLNRINPRLSLWVARRMNFVSSPFLAINHIVKAVKRDASR